MHKWALNATRVTTSLFRIVLGNLISIFNTEKVVPNKKLVYLVKKYSKSNF